MEVENSIIITGVKISYYLICQRKLWLFSHNITMEHTSEYVEMGTVIHETSYERKRKEINFDGIKIDFYEKNNKLIHEVKKSKSLDESHKWQIKYYIYHLKKLGIDVKGQIDYPLLKKNEKVELTEDDITAIENAIIDINKIVNMTKPPPIIKKTFCSKCSYYDLCYV